MKIDASVQQVRLQEAQRGQPSRSEAEKSATFSPQRGAGWALAPSLPPQAAVQASVTKQQLPVEIENKYLLAALPKDLASYPKVSIKQGYLAIGEDGTVVRLRQKGDAFIQTVKTDGDDARIEVEIELSREQFASLWPLTEGQRLEKTRYNIPYGKHTIELDIYYGPLLGLRTAEVEFATKAERDAFVPPKWFGENVTFDERYKNHSLAEHGLPKGYQAC